MTALFSSFLGTAIKFLFFLLVSWGGIVCGKKYRDHKDAASAAAGGNETK
ncbi:hypothetical protein [Lacrimispora amygdalina]|jgi:hypothetical protein|nr:hypothetical protein [Lacrimispora amygdalina]